MERVPKLSHWLRWLILPDTRCAAVLPHSPKLQKFDDQMLLQISAAPSKPLFPLLRKAGAMVPLVALIALLPCLYAFEHRTWTDAGSLWGLQGLQRMHSTNPDEFFDPGKNDSTAAHPASIGDVTPCKWQPPAMGMLTALCLRAFGSQRDAGPVISACLSTMSLIAVAFLLARRVGGKRLGLLACLLLASNPEILKLAQEPIPHAATQMFASLCLWCVVSHWQHSNTAISLWLLPAGLFLGACLLTGGAVALATFAALVGYVLWQRVHRWSGAVLESRRLDSPSSLWREMISLFIVAATAFAASGWWLLMMNARYGVNFWHAWFSWTSPGTPDFPADFTPRGVWTTIQHLHACVLPLFPLAVFGGIQIVRDHTRVGASDGGARRLFLSWVATGIVAWIVSDLTLGPNLLAERAWQTPLIIALVMLAAVGLLEIEERRTSFGASLAVLLLSCALIPAVDAPWIAARSIAPPLPHAVLDPLAGTDVPGRALLLIATLTVAIVFVWFSRGHAGRQRTILTVLAIFVLIGSFARGGVNVRRSTADDRELKALRLALLKLKDVEGCTLIAARAAAANTAPSVAPLLYLMRSIWPESRLAHSWNLETARRLARSVDRGTQIVVVWGGRRHPNLPGGNIILKPTGSLYYYHTLEIATYEVTRAAL